MSSYQVTGGAMKRARIPDPRSKDVREVEISFDGLEGLVHVLSPKRLELLHHLRQHPAASITALAKAVGRNYRRVHDDVDILRSVGLISQTPGIGLHTPFDFLRVEARIDF